MKKVSCFLKDKAARRCFAHEVVILSVMFVGVVVAMLAVTWPRNQ